MKYELPQDLIARITEALYGKCAAIYYVDLTANRYRAIRADEDFDLLLGAEGDMNVLTDIVFFRNDRTPQGEMSGYRIFEKTEDLISRDYYHGMVTVKVEDRERTLDFRIMRISETESVILFIEDHVVHQAEREERLKMEILQENYLFSMMINLADDTCRGSATTEISIGRQDYLDIKYSRWRMMIVNMFRPQDQEVFLRITEPEYILEHLERSRQFKYEITMKNMQGEYIWVRLMFSRTKDFSREKPVFVYTVQDIHKDMMRLLHQKNIIDAVQEENEKLISANKAKSVFISNMSHEIRTPINAVLGLDEMILRESSQDNILEYATGIRNAGKMLLSTINDILDFSKIEAGKMEIIPVEYNIHSMMKDLNDMITSKVMEKNLTFTMEVNPDLPKFLFGDEIRIKQVITNLLTNAVKYTERGNVTLTVDYIPRKDDEIDLCVKVQDTGIGMRPENIGKLFDRYSRFDAETNRTIEGTGLGMGIVNGLLEQMDGKITVESVYGKGSTFVVTLPQRVMHTRTQDEDSNAQKDQEAAETLDAPLLYAPGARILAVDDNRMNLVVLGLLLKRSCVHYESVRSGRECLELLRQNPDFDLILLDHLMPEMDGIQTLGHIRELGGKWEEIPVIALTANVMSGARESYMIAGFSDFLEKPVNAEKLERMLLTYLPADCLEEK